MWKVVCQSVRGRSHRERNLPCQDYGAYRLLGPQLLIGAVADGAGSAPLADIGSRLAVETALAVLEREMGPMAATGQLPIPAPAEKLARVFKPIFHTVLGQVEQRLEEEAKRVQHPVEALSSTLIVLVASPAWTAALQIGDGFILFRSQGEAYQLLFQPDKGEYANETTFVTAKDVLAQAQIKAIDEAPEFLCVATDGIENVSINLANWEPFPPFFQPLDRYLEETPAPLEEELREFLERPDLDRETTDDKTLLLARWQ